MFLLIKDFPITLQKTLKTEAKKKGMTLKGYIVELLKTRPSSAGPRIGSK